MNAAIALALGAGIGLMIVALIRMAVREALGKGPKPFWMGEWPPVRGGIIDDSYRYDHLPLDGVDDDIARTVMRAGLRPGERLEVVPKPGRLAHKAAEQARGREDVQSACGIDVDAAGVVNLCVQLVTHKAAPDRDARARLKPARQAHHVIRITRDGPTNQFCIADVTLEQAGGCEANALDGDCHETAIDDAHTETSVGIRLQAPRIGAGDPENLPVLHLSITAVPKRDDPQPHAIPPQRPPGVDDAQHGTERRAGNGEPACPIDASKPCRCFHCSRSGEGSAESIAQGGAA